MELENRTCRRILQGDLTFSEGADVLQCSLSSIKRKVKRFKTNIDLKECTAGENMTSNVNVMTDVEDNGDREEEKEAMDDDEKEEESDDEEEDADDDGGHDYEEEGTVSDEQNDEDDNAVQGEFSGGDDNGQENAGNSDNSEDENTDFIPAMNFDFQDSSHLNHFLCNVGTVNDLVIKISNHAETCDGKIIPFKQYVLPKGHIGYTAFFALYKCLSCKLIIQFCPSPLFNGRPISDYLVCHAKYTAGGVWENVERFTETLGFSSDFGDDFTSNDFNIDLYCDTVCDMADESMKQARNEVIVEENKLDGSFDASHLNRTNSPCSCVSMLSPDTLKVICSAIVHRSEESISQNHEAVGTRKICHELKRDGFSVRAFSCDDGSRTTSVMGEEFEESHGNLDPYHGLKNDKKVIEKCTKGKKDDKGKTWHPQLAEKGGPLVEHLRYCIKFSTITVEQYRDPGQRAEAAKKLKARVLIPLRHYRDIHDKCFPSARCNVDPKYRLSRVKITDDAALKLLEKTLTSTVIFRQAHKYLLYMPTSMNESYHSRQNKYFSKRTCLSGPMYSMVIRLAILDHNENTDGMFRNGKRVEALPLDENGLSKQPITSRSFVYSIWKNYMLRRMAMV